MFWQKQADIAEKSAFAGDLKVVFLSDFGKIKKIEKTLKKALIFPSKFVIITPVLFVKNGTMSLIKRLVLLQYNVVFNTNTV